MEILIVAIGFIGWIVGFALLRGWVLAWLWLWFVVPVFHLPPLSIVQAIGVSMVFSFLTTSLSDTKDEYRKSAGERAIDGILYNFIALGIGYIVHLFL